MTYRYVIIGGGIAGTNAAFSIRKHDPEGGILIIGEEPLPVYSRVNLGSVVSGKQTPDQLILKQEDQYDQAYIDRSFNTRVTHIDHTHRLLETTNQDYVGYEKLLIATGGSARSLPAPGADLPGVFTFQNLAEAARSAQYIANKETVLVVGGGFIGIEFVELLSNLGKNVILVVRESWYWANTVSQEGGEHFHDYLQSRATVLYQTEVKEFHGEHQVESVTLTNGETYNIGAAYIGIGITLNQDFIPDNLLHINQGILTNEYLQTSARDIYAAGDVAEYFDIRHNIYAPTGSWVIASTQGNLAGHNMTHPISVLPFDMVPSFMPKISLPTAFIGDCRPQKATETIIIKNTTFKYIQANFRKSKLLGLIVIGDASLMGKGQKLLKEKAPLSETQRVLT